MVRGPVPSRYRACGFDLKRPITELKYNGNPGERFGRQRGN